MELVKIELEVPKESKEVIDLLEAVGAKIKAKAPLAEYAELLDELYVAIEGAQKLGAEVSSAQRSDAAALLVKKLLDLALPVVEAPALPVAE